ncbi:MAG: hypothetical protein ACR2NS_10475 [Gemmatimonadaceae bacterium]
MKVFGTVESAARSFSRFLGVLLLFGTAACRPDGLTRPPIARELKIDPAVAARLKADRYTGTVISFVDQATGQVRSRASQALLASQRKAVGKASPTVIAPAFPAMTMDLTSDLMFIVQPAGGWKTPGGTPQFTFTLFWNCYLEGEDHGQLRNVTVGNITNTPLEGSGGHTGSHSSPKPFGMTNPFTGVTDADGFFTTLYTATEISGDESMDVDWSTSDQASDCVGFSGTDRYWHATRWDGLTPLTPTGDFQFLAIQSHHDNIYYAAAGIDQKVHKTARAYRLAFPADTLWVTAASLVYGGLEDIHNNWKEDHQLHRTGADVDFDGVRDDHTIWDPLGKFAKRVGGFRKCEPHGGSHLHCYTTQYSNPNLH